MASVLEFCSKNLVRSPSENSFISPQLGDWLSGHPTCSHPENLEVADYIKNGILLKTPSQTIPVKDSALKSPTEHNTCTINDLLKGCSKNGGYLGPFEYTGQTYALVSYTDYNNQNWVSLNKINAGLDVFRVKKEKRLMRYAGRLVANMTKNLMNDDYSFQERTVSMPSFQDQVHTSKGAAFLFILDFIAAYRQLRYDCRSWGIVAFVFMNKLFIDIALSFGWGPAARCFHRFTRALLRALTWYFPELFLERPIAHLTLAPLTDNDNSNVPFIDDLKFVSLSSKQALAQIAVLKNLASKYNMKLDFEEPLKMIKTEAKYCGWIHNLIHQAIKFPVDKRKKLLNMLTC